MPLETIENIRLIIETNFLLYQNKYLTNDTLIEEINKYLYNEHFKMIFTNINHKFIYQLVK
jgi:hypothetical protein